MIGPRKAADRRERREGLRALLIVAQKEKRKSCHSANCSFCHARGFANKRCKKGGNCRLQKQRQKKAWDNSIRGVNEEGEGGKKGYLGVGGGNIKERELERSDSIRDPSKEARRRESRKSLRINIHSVRRLNWAAIFIGEDSGPTAMTPNIYYTPEMEDEGRGCVIPSFNVMVSHRLGMRETRGNGCTVWGSWVGREGRQRDERGREGEQLHARSMSHPAVYQPLPCLALPRIRKRIEHKGGGAEGR